MLQIRKNGYCNRIALILRRLLHWQDHRNNKWCHLRRDHLEQVNSISSLSNISVPGPSATNTARGSTKSFIELSTGWSIITSIRALSYLWHWPEWTRTGMHIKLDLVLNCAVARWANTSKKTLVDSFWTIGSLSHMTKLIIRIQMSSVAGLNRKLGNNIATLSMTLEQKTLH